MPLLKLRWMLLLAGLTSTVCLAQQQSTDPEQERKSFKIADGFEINLFASDPMLVKPIEINWDNRGRLWVASSETYPQVKPGQVPNDKIIILEDTKGEGKADKATVFADHLFIPNAVAPGDGGAYVTNSTEIVHFDETGTTGKSTNRRVVLSGFGTEDTHHIVHTLKWGYDGRLYFNQSIYIHTHLLTPWGTKTLLGSGTWRFHPENMELDVIAYGMVNPWGIVFDRWGRTYETDGAGGEGIYYCFPGAAFQSAVGFEKVMQGLNPNSPKYCSEEMLTGRHIPDDYQGDIITNDFRAHRMVRFKLHPDGSGFSSEQMPDFITSTDPAFRPVDIKMGPDGAIYIADWYNPIIQHGEVDFRDARRDHLHGRIWRVTAKGRQLVERPKIADASVSDLLELLKAPEDFTRQHAKIELRARGSQDVLPAVNKWVNQLDLKDPEHEHHLLEALWLHQTFDLPNKALLDTLLQAHDPRARAAALRVAWRWNDLLPGAPAVLAAGVADDDPIVRLEAIRGLAAIRDPESIVVACRALDKPRDKFIDYALWETANDLKDLWVPAVQSGKLTDWSKPEHLTFALQAVKSPEAIARLVEQLKSNQLPPESRGSLIDLVASIDPNGQADTFLDLALAKGGQTPANTLHLLAALRKIAKEHQVQPKNDPARIAALFDYPDEEVRTSAMRLAGTWHLEPLRPQISAIATSPEASNRLRAGALQAIANLGGQPSLDLLRSTSQAPNPPLIRCAAVAALAGLDLPDASARAAELLTSSAADGDPGILLGAFVIREDGADALAKSLADKKISPDSARLALRYMQEQTGSASPLADRFRAAAGLSSGPTRLTSDQMKQLVAEVAAKGDPARGELIFRRKETGCYQCHAINGAGGFLAPDLGSLGASSPLDYLADSILDPNKAVKDGFMGYAIVTKSGDVVSGVKVRQDAQTVVLRDNVHEQIEIARSDIRREKEIGSLMPTGLADSLTHAEFVDLLRFVSELGRPGPYGPTLAKVVRRWRIVDPGAASPGSDAGTFAVNGVAVYSLVSGDLPIDAIFPDKSASATVQCQIDVVVAGKVGFRLSSPDGLSIFIDQTSLTVANEMTADLAKGVHTLTVRVNRAARADKPLRIELIDLPGSPARASPVSGR